MAKEINWHKDALNDDTLITANYKTTQNVRRFFENKLGKKVHFNRDFMQWMHSAIGKTPAQAIEEYKLRNHTN